MLRDILLADILLRGYAGWNSRRAIQVIDKIFPKDAPVQPSLVVVYFGGNDSMGAHPSGLGPHVPLPEYIENLRKIANHLKSLSERTRIIFLSCPPVNEEMLRERTSDALSPLVRTNEICRQYSEACIELCEEMGVKAIDLWTAIQKREDWATSCFTDGVHFSSEGSNIVVEEMLKVLKGADWQPSLHWKSLPTEFGEDSPYDLVAPRDGKSTASDPAGMRLFTPGNSAWTPRLPCLSSNPTHELGASIYVSSYKTELKRMVWDSLSICCYDRELCSEV
ncbi:GDSL esterase/lipase CPRD49-like [Asparagus officinalis]|uniref:GDSL esterase/lipase CPRD49-like n=1 Tax=Asparagus officinalis TaxID=4686 RepID=UPI00098E0B97|nr:GDSL esterase/lipase CPRD49-like [Asparagus officinalis]